MELEENFMSLMNIFKKNPPKPNTQPVNTSAAYSKHRFSHTFVHTYGISPKDPSIFVEYENGEEVSQLRFSIYKNELKICDFLAGGDDKDYHHGTEMMIALLKHFKTPFVRIYGELSPIDAYNMNWTRSIPFYRDLPRHVFSQLGLKYEFYLFDDKNFEHDVTDILSIEEERDANIEAYRISHLYDTEGNITNRFGSFHYILS